MAFRDDREAMRARLEATEAELERTKRELASARGEADGARETATPAPGEDAHGWRALIFWSAFLLVCIGGVVTLFQTKVVTHPGFVPTTHAGAVTAVRGLDGVAPGQPCSLRVSPNPRGTFNCRLLLTCGARVVYGGGNMGFTHCALIDGAPVRATDTHTTGEEGDPALTLDLQRGALHLWDDTPGAVTLDVAFPPPRPKAME
jgi:hypothetical protein